ncbi:hypothetical protein VK792_04520 [Mesobacterium sp. TK19101]|uniref:Sulfotransferase family protein n=1 Tax=Mesobacterium hydrothermale TaxID=3111907 RepID=A0ABU6HDJ5_9RHOB|nr:hypothetical protein [Mesobacterium sp. TK19101]MEC3860537.1 hypothetical protein [Mesobacterium sp. TK19101]
MIINLGLPKSGTTTLDQALQSAGLKVADHKMRREDAAAPDLAGRPIARLLYDGYFQTGDPLTHLGQYDALGEISILRPNLSLWPQMDWGLLSAIRAHHPDTLFVATRRPAAAISDSMMRWRNLGTQRIPNGVIPGLPASYGATPDEQMRWIEGHYAFLSRVFERDPQFLMLDVGVEDARDRLAAFSGLTIPWWGRANVNPTS